MNRNVPKKCYHCIKMEIVFVNKWNISKRTKFLMNNAVVQKNSTFYWTNDFAEWTILMNEDITERMILLNERYFWCFRKRMEEISLTNDEQTSWRKKTNFVLKAILRFQALTIKYLYPKVLKCTCLGLQKV